MNDNERRLVVIGAGGHGKVVAEAAQLSGQFDEVVFYDASWPERSTHGPWLIVGRPEDLLAPGVHPCVAVVAIGAQAVRVRLTDGLRRAGHTLATVIHPRAAVSPRARLGSGTAVLAGAVVNIDAELGAACIVNTGVTIDHDCRLGDGVHVSPGAHLAGNVQVGEQSWIGTGGVIIPGIQVGARAVVGAGAVVIRNVADDTTVVGNPARILEKTSC